MHAIWAFWQQRQAHAQIDAIEAKLPELEKLTDAELTRQSLGLRYQARCGEDLDKLAVEALTLAAEASRRQLGMTPYRVQLLAALAIHAGSIVEMQTGEGKTLTAVFPTYLNALAGRGVHVATANDYLAQRDADLMRGVYELLGLSIGVIVSQTSPAGRKQAYASDVTYATARELGFDFLRDRIQQRELSETAIWGDVDGAAAHGQVQRELCFALIDEADSILIDEARTPLVVSSSSGHSLHNYDPERLYLWAARLPALLEETEHFEVTPGSQLVELTTAGRDRVRRLAASESAGNAPLLVLYQYAERAVHVERKFLRDRNYIVRGDEVVIVDENTGRLAEGRRWKAGLHQAIEARENVTISPETGDAARITVQDFFLRYEKLAGMTGTIFSARSEMRKLYHTPVIVIPTHRPNRRQSCPHRILPTWEAKWSAIADEVKERVAAGRAVLVGTRSIDRSEALSAVLTQQEIEHQVLHARHSEREAEMIAAAGQPGRVTVATNMAGRGTDIQLAEAVERAGGLHVILSELHASSRIDRQLIGRCARQGDPGSYRYFLSMEDEILTMAYGEKKADALAKRFATATESNLQSKARLFFSAQAKVERQHFHQRKALLQRERHRQTQQEEMGEDACLDGPGV